MHSYWLVEQVTEKPGVVLAELRPVQWFRKNPDREVLDAEYDAFAKKHTEDEVTAKYLGIEWPEEFTEAHPGEEGAEHIEGDGPRITIDITEGPELHPLDNVILALTPVSILPPVDA